MYKMIVSDFCGTLIDSEEAISVSTMLELDRVRKDGIIFCITTSKLPVGNFKKSSRDS